MSKIKKAIPSKLRPYLKTIRNEAYKVFYKGNKVECPICGSKFGSFAKYGGGAKIRENALCPGCGSLERHRLLWLFLNKKDLEHKRILHFAPEKSFYKRFRAIDSSEYIAGDLIPELYPFAELVRLDVTDLQYDDNSFDVILCNHVLEHVPDDAKAMSELNRVMNKGGWGVFQIPIEIDRATTYENWDITSPRDREREFGQEDHVRVYGKDFVDRLRNAGFNITEDKFVESFSQSDQVKYGLDPNEIIFFVEKP